MPRWPPRNDDALIAAYLAGASMTEVAQRFGLTVSAVYSRLPRAKVPLRPRSHTAIPGAADRAALIAAYREGESMTTLATRFGLSRETVARALRAAGGTERPRRLRKRQPIPTPRTPPPRDG